MYADWKSIVVSLMKQHADVGCHDGCLCDAIRNEIRQHGTRRTCYCCRVCNVVLSGDYMIDDAVVCPTCGKCAEIVLLGQDHICHVCRTKYDVLFMMFIDHKYICVPCHTKSDEADPTQAQPDGGGEENRVPETGARRIKLESMSNDELKREAQRLGVWFDWSKWASPRYKLIQAIISSQAQPDGGGTEMQPGAIDLEETDGCDHWSYTWLITDIGAECENCGKLVVQRKRKK